MGKMINEGFKEEHAENIVAEIIDKVKASGVDPCKKTNSHQPIVKF
jgi:hypothetical protein